MSGGAVAVRVAANLRALRKSRGMSTYDVAARLADIGWSIQQTGVARIETGQRRVDVDDLVALAAVRQHQPEPADAAADRPGPGRGRSWHAARGRRRPVGLGMW